ncbi:NfeD family protein [Neomegalonema sp.]|uniref:NfeD family protein n=1 Tax=Neomegalonema sp. TaxID=2039713 RepID=UPI0026182C4D|nr:NfeD family protein [Neomegalonema sp.]MDD2870047.1 NfeD family protein [Neomegalonema sp.]
MDVILGFMNSHAVWGWIIVGLLLLIAETFSGDFFLAGPAAAALLVAAVLAVHPPLLPNLNGQLLAFAALAFALGISARRISAPWRDDAAADGINDRMGRTLGRETLANGEFVGGRGTVQVDGVMWRARLEEGETVPSGAPLIVTAHRNGQLIVRRLQPGGAAGGPSEP